MATSTPTVSGFPNASNTGVPAGVILTPSGGITVTKAGTVIEGLDIKGQVNIQAANVTLKNCKITSSGYAPVNIKSGLTGVVVQDCEINGTGSNNDGSHGIAGQGTFLRNNIYNVENGINVQGNNTVIDGNYIHDLNASGAPHYDGVQIDGGVSNVTVTHNTVINNQPGVSAVMVDNYFGAVSNIKIDGNYLAGGGFPLYSDGTFTGSAMTNVSFTNNYITKGGWGYYYVKSSSPTISGNVESTDGHFPDQGPTPTPTPDPTPDPTPTPPPVTGTSGNDVIKGTSGADVMVGGTGNDTYTVNHTGDKVVELAGQGTDKVESTISHTLADNVENLQLMGSNAINGTGNALNNTIIGNDAANILKGGDGNDRLNGWGGKDVLYGGAGKDVFEFSSQFSANGDKVMDFVHGTDKLDFSLIDANTSKSGDQAFVFDGYQNGGQNGHLWAVEDSTSNVTHVYGKVGGFQFVVDLQGVHHGLTASDFYL
ncbi:calcium-binding protein [Microvirga terricola]|uniref:Right handed beta helix domain-containing protein n=1 Tax=Microvirga terricola TaxID=2719797 RepID=A0ABX0V767_9HYPH|nr:right-handed parallel beta-helix repeat-containing protein [Microvirga terricola]NIX75684.1 hypothetical protein [Microvirga terricola]